MAKKQTKKAPVIRKRTSKVSSSQANEPDSTYFLKLVMYFIFGTFWVHVSTDNWVMPIPIGFLVGMAFATHDHFKVDRKIEYAVLVVAMFVSYFLTPRFILSF